ncbi:uncharacterized protein [Parasteatoda tepidariorum]|uniref:uncharacterized protein n=1 Tax=Parasteatoda tepidariorum TaxID=114398 RepID=UPI00077F9853|nr:uncharacterized protein LOC107444652 [Parasteatoda tepidariorum]
MNRNGYRIFVYYFSRRTMMKSLLPWLLIMLGFVTSKNDAAKRLMHSADDVSPDKTYFHHFEAFNGNSSSNTPIEKDELNHGSHLQSRSLKFFPLVDLTGNTTATVSPADVFNNWRQRKRDAITNYLKRLGIYQ